MKFGKNLDRGRVAEWAKFYVDYNKLKELLEQVPSSEESAEDASKRAQTWDTSLWSEVEKVNHHFSHTASMLEDRVSALEETWYEVVREKASRDGGDSGEEDDTGRGGGRNSKMMRRHLEVSLLESMVTLERLVDFSSMNYTAFYKILKKHDKKKSNMAGGKKQLPLLKEIENQPFHDRKRMEALSSRMDSLSEELGGDVAERYRERSQKSIKNHAALCFWLGFITMGLLSTGVMLTLHPTNPEYNMKMFMVTFPIFRFWFMLILLIWLSGWAAFWFEKYKINYIFLLGLDPTIPIDSGFMFKLAATMSGAWLLIFWLYLADFKFSLLAQVKSRSSLVVYVCVLVVCMVGLLIRMNRRRPGTVTDLLRCLLAVCMAPWIPVTFASNLCGDVLTSFTRPLTDLLYSGCFFTMMAIEPQEADLPTHLRTLSYSQTCHQINNRWVCSVILSLPYIFRLLQCFRRYYDAPETPHLVNAGKYLASITVSAVASAAPNSLLWATCYSVATVYALTWDFTKDWGLSVKDLGLQREQQMYPQRVYMLFAYLNLVGRSTWAFSTLTPQVTAHVSGTVGDIFMELFIFVVSAFEIYRRAQWAILRIEHEHLTNSSKYRTLCWVPPLANSDALGEHRAEVADAAGGGGTSPLLDGEGALLQVIARRASKKPTKSKHLASGKDEGDEDAGHDLENPDSPGSSRRGRRSSPKRGGDRAVGPSDEDPLRDLRLPLLEKGAPGRALSNTAHDPAPRQAEYRRSRSMQPSRATSDPASPPAKALFVRAETESEGLLGRAMAFVSGNRHTSAVQDSMSPVTRVTLQEYKGLMPRKVSKAPAVAVHEESTQRERGMSSEW
eukprot:TRINITY_DN27171_c0_g1_i1.p1 TRINITY_DN27171_c0_g1~~TRINITY_DN27171_c0_g1_i1.p1  ORF type:complete len:842 (+),score=161.12 TRINITY_DN27171_c0_g1_i1:102-2627(+)